MTNLNWIKHNSKIWWWSLEIRYRQYIRHLEKFYPFFKISWQFSSNLVLHTTFLFHVLMNEGWVKKFTKLYNVRQQNWILRYLCYLEKERERNKYREEKGHLHFKKRPFFPLMDRKRGMRYRKRSHQERDMWCHKKPARLFEIGNAVIEEHGTFKCQEKSQFKKRKKR